MLPWLLILLSWFIGHMATLGCSKYKKKFSGGFGKNYLLVLTEKHGEKRSNEDHRICEFRVWPCKTKIEREKLESETEVRYSVLLGLPYYDAIRMVLIDPMHNLFLGKESYNFFKPCVLSQDLPHDISDIYRFPWQRARQSIAS